MPRLGWYGVGNADNVTDAGNLWGWTDASGDTYGALVDAPRKAYRFGPAVNNFGTWGQMIYRASGDLSAGVSQATGLTGHMPNNPAPDNNIWIQGHLVNSELGGDGSLQTNLTPLCHNVNQAMKKYDNAVKRLVNADGSMIVRFNPHGLANCRVIYRVQATNPPAGTNPNALNAHPFATVPNGVVMSLGIVIGGALKSSAQLDQHFLNPPLNTNQRWFSNGYYMNGDTLTQDRMILSLLIGGVELRTP